MEKSTSAGDYSLDGMKAATSQQVKDWLRNALASFHATRSSSAFAPFQSWIRRGDTLAADLHLIYLSIPPQNQAAWHAAIADLIAELPAEQSHAQSMKVLVDLARSIPVYDVFVRAGRRITSRNFAQLTLPNGETLYRRCLKLAIELATDTEAMRSILLSFAQSEFFPRTLALQMLAALGRSSPRHWTSDLKMLRPRISDLLKNDPPSARGIRRQAAALLAAIGLEQATEGLVRLQRAPDHDLNRRWAYDDWLLDEFFFGPDPLIERFDSGPDVIFSMAANPDIRHVVDRAILDKSIVGWDVRDVVGGNDASERSAMAQIVSDQREEKLRQLQRQLEGGFERIGISAQKTRSLEPA